MRNPSNPFRGIGLRSGLALLLVAALAVTALLSGAATAEKPRQANAPKQQKPVPSSTSIASARAIAARVKAIVKEDAKIRRSAAISAKKKSGPVELDFPIYAVADGNALYSSTIKLKVDRRSEDLTSLRLVLERTDRATGAKVKLLDKINTYPLGIYARGGSVGIETLSFAETRTKKGSDLALKTAIYTATHSDAALKAIDVAPLTQNEDEEICGKFSVLAGLSDVAEPMIAVVDAVCGDDASDFDELTADLQLWAADGSRKSLGPAALESVFFGDSFILTGSKLLQPSPYQPATSLRDVGSGALANLWTPSSSTADLAADGTVALVGWPSAQVDYATYGYGTLVTDSEAVAVTPPPIDAEKYKPPVRKYPLVVFPRGDAENPVMVNASRQGIADVKFCGPNLFVLDRIAEGRGRGYDPEVEDEFFLTQYFSSYKYDIQLYDSQGRLVRSLVKTHPLALAGIGCNGDKLILIALRNDKFATTELGT